MSATNLDAALTSTKGALTKAQKALETLRESKQHLTMKLANAAHEVNSCEETLRQKTLEKNTIAQAYEAAKANVDLENLDQAARQARDEQISDAQASLRAITAEEQERATSLAQAQEARDAAQLALNAVTEDIENQYVIVERSFATLIEKTSEDAAAVKEDLKKEEKSDVDSDLEKRSGLTITSEDQAVPVPADCTKWKVAFSSIGLKDSLQHLLDHLSTERIAEEMDTATYLRRLRDALDRAKRKSKSLRDLQIGHRGDWLKDFEQEAMRMFAAYREQLERADWAGFRERQAAIAVQLNRMEEEIFTDIDCRKPCYDHAVERLLMLENDVLSPDTYEWISSVSSIVSDEIAKQPLLRIRPALIALFASVLGYYAMGNLYYPFVIAHTFIAIGVIFLIVYAISIRIGKGYRNAIMDKVRRHVSTSISEYLHTDPASENAVVFRAVSYQQFDTLSSEKRPPIQPTAIRFAANRMQRNKSILLMLIPVVALAISLLFSASLTFVAKESSGGFCRLAEGRIVYSDTDHYFVQPVKVLHLEEQRNREIHGIARRLTEKLFPTINAIPVFRPNIASIYQVIPKELEGIPLCGDIRDPKVASGNPAVTPEVHLSVVSAAKREILQEIANVPVATPSMDHAVERLMRGHEQHSKLLTRLTESEESEATALTGFSTSLSKLVDFANDKPNLPQQVFVVMQTDTPTTSAGDLADPEKEKLKVGVSNKMLVLPFFRVPVYETNNTIDGAFNAGVATFTDPAQLGFGGDDGVSYFERFANTVKLQALNDPDKSVVLDVMGFASEGWEVPPAQGGATIAQLNHALAEGRRSGVLSKLQTALGPEAGNVGFVQMSNESDNPIVVCLSEWNPRASWEIQKRFKDHVMMRDGLAQVLKNVSGIADMENFWARSVVISFRVRPSRC